MTILDHASDRKEQEQHMKRIRVLVSLVIVASSLFMAAPPAGAVVGDPYNYAVLKNSIGSDGGVLVCRDWGGDGRCASGSPRGMLYPGEDSYTKFDWRDTDGFYVGRGWYVVHGAFDVGPRWVKKSGCLGCTRYLYVKRISSGSW